MSGYHLGIHKYFIDPCTSPGYHWVSIDTLPGGYSAYPHPIVLNQHAESERGGSIETMETPLDPPL